MQSIRRLGKPPEQGFTLIEFIIVIVISGIIGGMVTVFMRTPIDAYFSATRRAAITDTADLALRRMTRDIHKALPNSIRSNVDNTCIEFIPTKVGGRYRANPTGNATLPGDILDFTIADTTFDMFGLNSAFPANQQIVPQDLIAIYNLGYTGADAYQGNNIAPVTAIGPGTTANEDRISITSFKFPLASPGNRFQVIPNSERIVSFVCDKGQLFRVTNYPVAANTVCPIPGGQQGATFALLAQNVSNCTFNYSGSNVRNALVGLTLELTKDGETVSLYMETHVNNIP